MARYLRLFVLCFLLVSLLIGCSPNTAPVPDNVTEETSTEPETTDEDTVPTVEQSSEPEGTETVSVNIPTYVGYTVAKVNAYSLPSEESEVLTVLDPHTDVEIFAEADSWIQYEPDWEEDWYRIRLNEQTAFVRKEDARVKQTQLNGYVIAIDPGHQLHGNYDKEPIGPGSDTMKAKVSSGTQGRTTGLPEYELNLQVALKLQKELENRGYTVIMIRTTNEVNISNSERAAIANEANADAFIRIHANGSENTSVSGAMTICQGPNNPYNGSMYSLSRLLSECVLDAFVEATECRKTYVWETNTMSGINWCQIPVTILEMGYMTNPEEDKRMATEEYQYKMVQGIANGIDRFIRESRE